MAGLEVERHIGQLTEGYPGENMSGNTQKIKCEHLHKSSSCTENIEKTYLVEFCI